jgi:hypothetical protein
MALIILKGWKDGLLKISLTNLQTKMLNIGLKQSKNNVDLLLDGNTITIDVNDYDLAIKFIEEANKIGALGEVLNK